jgi:hypothetical protein
MNTEIKTTELKRYTLFLEVSPSIEGVYESYTYDAPSYFHACDQLSKDLWECGVDDDDWDSDIAVYDHKVEEIA